MLVRKSRSGYINGDGGLRSDGFLNSHDLATKEQELHKNREAMVCMNSYVKNKSCMRVDES